jgi:hypothetical protein
MAQLPESQVMARVRHEVLTVLYHQFPKALGQTGLVEAIKMPFLTRDKQWLQDSVKEQLQVLHHAGLIRPANGGYTLTERGRRDRQQAARFLSNKINPPTDAA